MTEATRASYPRVDVTYIHEEWGRRLDDYIRKITDEYVKTMSHYYSRVYAEMYSRLEFELYFAKIAYLSSTSLGILVLILSVPLLMTGLIILPTMLAMLGGLTIVYGLMQRRKVKNLLRQKSLISRILIA